MRSFGVKVFIMDEATLISEIRKVWEQGMRALIYDD